MILDSKNLIYKAVYHGARSFIEVFATLEVEGWENVPAGACLFASNHQSMLDPPLLGSCLPREISFIARRTLFDNPVFGFVIRACHSIPVDRGEADIGAIRAALAALAAGEGLLIFPEGTRSHDGVITSPKAGAGLLALGAVAPASFMSHFTVFVLACFVGYMVIWNVTAALHTPLMSVTNAISGIILVGALLQVGHGDVFVSVLAFIAILVALGLVIWAFAG